MSAASQFSSFVSTSSTTYHGATLFPLPGIVILSSEMDSVRPYQIHVPTSEVEGLNQRLLNSRIPELFEQNWERGPPAEDIKRISEYWRDQFSWRAFEDRLNQLPQYETTITLSGFEPFQVHFIHQRSQSHDAIPLLFIHGCAYTIQSLQLEMTADLIYMQGRVASTKYPGYCPYSQRARRTVALLSMLSRPHCRTSVSRAA